MYTLDLICSNGHRFEGWFTSRDAFEEQREAGAISCLHCNDTNVQQQISPVRIKRHGKPDNNNPAKNSAVNKTPAEHIEKDELAKLNIIKYFEKNFEDVGTLFVEEAIKMHLGETEMRSIRGTATSEEENVLTEEGISFFKLPNFQ